MRGTPLRRPLAADTLRKPLQDSRATRMRHDLDPSRFFIRREQIDLAGARASRAPATIGSGVRTRGSAIENPKKLLTSNSLFATRSCAQQKSDESCKNIVRKAANPARACARSRILVNKKLRLIRDRSAWKNTSLCERFWTHSAFPDRRCCGGSKREDFPGLSISGRGCGGGRTRRSTIGTRGCRRERCHRCRAEVAEIVREPRFHCSLNRARDTGGRRCQESALTPGNRQREG